MKSILLILCQIIIFGIYKVPNDLLEPAIKNHTMITIIYFRKWCDGMGKISKVYYKQISDNRLTLDNMLDSYFFKNTNSYTDRYHDEHMMNEMKQVAVRDEIVSNARVLGFTGKDSVIGLSSIMDKIVVIV